jgi:L-fuculose-phosphate aldolase
MRYVRLRRDIIASCLDLLDSAIVSSTAGNVSTRVPGGFLITPTGIMYRDMRPRDIVEVGMSGDYAPHDRIPSSEWRFHRDLYSQRADVGAVVHGHPVFCTALACQGLDIPAFHYMVAVAGGDDIRCAPYATFGTQELSDSICSAMLERRACLLAHHGMVSTGLSLSAATRLAVEVESLAAQYWHALQLGTPTVLSAEEMRRVLERFATYGQQRDSGLNDC